MGVSLISPALPAVRTGLGISEAEAALLLSAFTLPGIVLGPVAGILADRYGRRVVLIPSLLVYGVSGSAVMLAPGIWTAVALRVVQGGAAAGLITLAITLVGDVFDGTERNRVLGINGAVLSVGTGIYPLAGGLLSTIDWRAPFAVYLVGIPVGLFAMRVLEEPERLDRHAGGGYLQGALRALPAGRAVMLYGTALVVFVLLYGGVLTGLPFLLDADFALSASGIGLVISVASVATAIASGLNGRLARVAGNPWIIAAGFTCLGLGLYGLGAATTPVWAGIAILPFGAGMGLVMPSLDAAVSQLVPGSYRGGAMSIRTSMVRLGQTLGPPIATGLTATWGYRVQLLATGVGATAAGVLALWWLALARRGPDR